MKKNLLFFALVAAAASAPALQLHAAPGAPLQSFVITDHLAHRWTDELVHFDFDVAARGDLGLTDDNGRAVPAQFSALKRREGRVSGRLWTVASLAPGGTARFALRTGVPPAAGRLSLTHEGNDLVLANEHMAVRLPFWPGKMTTARALTGLPAPIGAVRQSDGKWLASASWYNNGKPLRYKQAATTVLQRGPVRIVVQQRVVLADGRFHNTKIELGVHQQCALLSEDSDINDTAAGWRLSMKAGLGADHVLWNNQWKKTENAGTFGLADSALDFKNERVVAKLRPWSFWWLGDITLYAGFYQRGHRPDAEPTPGTNPFVGVLMLNPSHWTPGDWDGFDRLEIPIMTGPDGRIDMDFAFLANRVKDAPSKPSIIMEQPDPSKWAAILAKYNDIDVPLHREWALTAGTVAENVVDVKAATLLNYAGDPRGTIKLRRQLLKYGEFPLDEVKDYGFDAPTAATTRSHPFLLINDAAIARVRRQAKENPALKAQIEVAEKYVAESGALAAYAAGGVAALQEIKYSSADYNQKLPEAYFGSDDPIYGKLLAASVVNLTQSVRRVFIEAPSRPGLASYGPWPAEEFTRLLFAYDLVARRGLLTAAEEAAAHDTIVFAGQVLSNPNYWSLKLGLCSANPNMTSMIRLPLGLIGLFLAGHPQAAAWSGDAEIELKHELKDWIAPGGAWIESPGYQGASLDGILLFATAVRQVNGRDYFSDPQFKAMMEYFGFLLTPPDRRLPVRRSIDIPTMSQPGAKPPAALPTIGDTPIGSIFPFNGWMAAMTAATDPDYSAHQQFFWKLQNYHFNSGNRAKGFTVALTDTMLPAQPPSDLSRGFPGFGSVMRSSWTDPLASYVAHRTGPFSHHYHQDFNSFVYFAKGSPLCLDFGNQYVPVRREEPWYHNRVSFNITSEPVYEDNWKGVGGELVAMRALGGVLDYSCGSSYGRQGQRDVRHMLLLKSPSSLGANYLVVRDITSDGDKKAPPFYWNLWCLSKAPQIAGDTVHFPGQFDVDLDLHMVSPKGPQFTTDFWKWSDYKHIWGPFNEEQYGVRLKKSGSSEDFFAVLYPRAAGQPAATVKSLADGAALGIGHMEGRDLVLLSPGKPAQAVDGELRVSGEIAFVRQYTTGGIRLAVVKGDSEAGLGAWNLSSSDAAALDISGTKVRGEGSGNAHSVRITLPPRYGQEVTTIDGKPATATRAADVLTLQLPAGTHQFGIAPR